METELEGVGLTGEDGGDRVRWSQSCYGNSEREPPKEEEEEAYFSVSSYWSSSPSGGSNEA